MLNDVILLASFGYLIAYGFEASDKANPVVCGRSSRQIDTSTPLKDKSVGYANVNFLEGGFFIDEWTEMIPGVSKFDLIYDYLYRENLSPSPPSDVSQDFLSDDDLLSGRVALFWLARNPYKSG